MTEAERLSAASPVVAVKAGADCLGEQRGLGVSVVAFKVLPPDESGLLVLENTFHAKGGPPRHLHHEQDEWFYVAEGEFILEVGQERFALQIRRLAARPARGAARLGPRRRCARQDAGQLHAGREDGGLLSRSDQGQRDAAARPGPLARARDGAARAAAGDRVATMAPAGLGDRWMAGGNQEDSIACEPVRSPDSISSQASWALRRLGIPVPCLPGSSQKGPRTGGREQAHPVALPGTPHAAYLSGTPAPLADD